MPLRRKHRQTGEIGHQGKSPDHSPDSSEDKLFPDLQANLKKIRQTLGNSSDIGIREIPLGESQKNYIAILYTDGLADQNKIYESIMKTVAHLASKAAGQQDQQSSPFSDGKRLLAEISLYNQQSRTVNDFFTLFRSLLSGDTVILVDGSAEGLIAGTKGWKDRGVMETSAENVVRGPREAFSESFRTNTSLIRRKIKDPNLWLETMQIGRVTHTDVGIMYINGIANPEIVQEVRDRLNRIDVDSILESGYIEEFIQDTTFTPFPTIYNTERPDVIAAELLEGKVAILVDGTPFVLVVPALLISFLHASEDYYQRADISSFLRILRYLSVFISLLGPSIYIAVTTFHQEMLPTQLLFGLAAQREQIPFPAFVEALLMELTFEILREAGVRLPKNIGSAISIVGTLVIGQAAVEAGIISAAMVIVVAITAISSFVLPAFNMSIAFRMLRFPLMALAGSFGLFGIFVGVMALILHLCSLRSFGVPYMAPLAPLIPESQKDSILRLPHWLLSTRPRLLSKANRTRRPGNPPKKSRSEN
ncbi:spore germination protein [Paenibacillus sp. alder61]|uniref:Spore germination protein n=1 Tax=Paenibacillus faecis TaxID=862114 RepID=A0A5D0CNM9_9BACL|nr:MULTISPECIES: spore germination protein [Paenibacillus]MCA1294837.1 spore germination protein [Paenibacillus sp. alder61]TYA11398.1 spore germination protein [Paenibacillus faecis]